MNTSGKPIIFFFLISSTLVGLTMLLTLAPQPVWAESPSLSQNVSPSPIPPMPGAGISLPDAATCKEGEIRNFAGAIDSTILNFKAVCLCAGTPNAAWYLINVFHNGRLCGKAAVLEAEQYFYKRFPKVKSVRNGVPTQQCVVELASHVHTTSTEFPWKGDACPNGAGSSSSSAPATQSSSSQSNSNGSAGSSSLGLYSNYGNQERKEGCLINQKEVSEENTWQQVGSGDHDELICSGVKSYCEMTSPEPVKCRFDRTKVDHYVQSDLHKCD